MSTIPTALRTLDTRHFGGWIYLVHLIVIYTMMYLIPTEIIFCSPRTNGSGSVWLINVSGDAWLFGTSGSLYIDGSYGLYYILRTLVICSLCGWHFQVDSLIIISIILYPIPTEALSEHGRFRWPLACLPFWLYLRQLLLQFLRPHLFRRTSFRMK